MTSVQMVLALEPLEEIARVLLLPLIRILSIVIGTFHDGIANPSDVQLRKAVDQGTVIIIHSDCQALPVVRIVQGGCQLAQ